MPGKSVLPRLEHIIEAIEALQRLTRRKTMTAIRRDRDCRLLIERNFEILSEASRHLPADLTTRHPDIPWHNVRNIGNVIRHNYDGVDPELLLKIVQDDLPALEQACRTERALALARQDPA